MGRGGLCGRTAHPRPVLLPLGGRGPARGGPHVRVGRRRRAQRPPPGALAVGRARLGRGVGRPRLARVALAPAARRVTSGEGAGERPACLAIDIGASKVAVAVVSPEGVVEDVGRLAVAEHPRDLFGAVCDLATARLERSRVDRVGVGCAGPMSAGGESVSPLNIPAWRDFPLRGALARELGLPVSVEGDARALALGEGRYGAARGVSDYLSMVVSTGVGGGLPRGGGLRGGDRAAHRPTGERGRRR
ncbi:MAG: hypothetical protein B7Z69_05250 [Actinobacteria bacterium 21-73-9]|nr:MAG: hypothetical protein B7Z69_05250 [Actinobacteria bacterium 21-73-9]